MTFGIDGHAGGVWSSGTSFATGTVTCANPGNVINVVVALNFGNVTSVSASGVTFVQKTATGAPHYLEHWQGYASGTFNDAVTINVSSGTSFGRARAFAVSGAPSSAYFDTNAGLPSVSASYPADPRTVSTDAADAMVIGMFRMLGEANPTAGSGFTQVGSDDHLCVEIKIISAPASGLSVTLGTGAGDAYAAIADAIVADVAISPTIVATDSPDSASITTPTAVPATIAAVESSDVASITSPIVRVGRVGWIDLRAPVVVVSATIAATDSPDSATIACTNAGTAQIAGGESSDTCTITATATGAASIGAVESSDVAAISAVFVSTLEAQIAAVESSDTCAITSPVVRVARVGWIDLRAPLVATAGTIAAIDSPDSASINTTATHGAQIAAVESCDTCAIVADAGEITPPVVPPVAPGVGGPRYRIPRPLPVIPTDAVIGCIESSDSCVMAVSADRSVPVGDVSDLAIEFRRRVDAERERDDWELLLEL